MVLHLNFLKSPPGKAERESGRPHRSGLGYPRYLLLVFIQQLIVLRIQL